MNRGELMSKGPSMMDQFHEIKTAHPDTVLFFRMGDFYEMFHEDAVVASEVLGITLTSRDKNSDDPIPMAGVPWHSVEEYLRRMLRAGHKVTLCEQAETLEPGERILRRVVTRVFTPGSLFEEGLIGEDATAALAALVIDGERVGLALFDPSTGRAWVQQFEGSGRLDRLRDAIQSWSPSEIVTSRRDAADEMVTSLVQDIDGLVVSSHETTRRKRLDTVRLALKVADLGHIDMDESPLGMEACGMAASYVASLHLIDAVPMREVIVDSDGSHMVLDRTTLRNLEVTHTLAGERAGSLVQAVDRTKTWMGRRMLREWLLHPLLDQVAIGERNSAVASLVKASRRLADLQAAMQSMRDLERLSTRLVYDRADGRDLFAIANALERLPRLAESLTASSDPLLNRLAVGMSDLEDVRAVINERLVDEPPPRIRDGGLIRSGINGELDDLRQAAEEGDAWLRRFESAERERLDIPTLKIRSNRQFGYFVEVTKTHIDKVPDSYRRRQTLTNAERYTTDELAEWEDLILNSETRSRELEHRLFLQLREEVKKHASNLSELARKVAQVDVLCSFAYHAREQAWVRPEITSDERLDIVGGRHPVLESVPGFVPNDCNFGKDRRFLLLTGPNMGGKSTYLRQIALISILAQSGSFVPAERARIGLVDRVFTRVGAHDDLRRGRSTFMVEMIEVAHILRTATSRSLVLLDEIGRGTSTFDGLAIAWAVTEDAASRVAARTLFATHYHQLVGLQGVIEGLFNIHVQVAHAGDDLRFLHTVAEGPCDDSYGVQVAALAGLPARVVERARDLLLFLENQADGARAGERGIPSQRERGQSSLFGWMLPPEADTRSNAPSGEMPEDGEKAVGRAASPLDACEAAALERLREIDPDCLSPREAIDLLYELAATIRGTHEWLEE